MLLRREAWLRRSQTVQYTLYLGVAKLVKLLKDSWKIVTIECIYWIWIIYIIEI